MNALADGGNRIRRELVEKSSEVEVTGKLHCNLPSVDKYLHRGVDLKFEFYRNPADFASLSADATLKLKI
jgi:hypothetical protein